jgi:DNA segregation ATPase FtsK/SpoIIIE, S-DNA-T family
MSIDPPSRKAVRLPRLRARDTRPDHDLIPVSSLSMWDPVFLGLDEHGVAVTPTLMYRNMLIGAEPGAGKSVALNNIVAHASQSTDVRLHLFDGKQVELGLWAPIADSFVGPDLTLAVARLTDLQKEMDRRYLVLNRERRRKILRSDRLDAILVVIDEIAFYSATAGDKNTREQFVVLLRDLVARGRAVCMPVVAATQRPSADIIPTSLRDIFGYRLAFRCTTDVSSDIVLGFGWASQGYSAFSIAPEDLGVGYLLAEGGIPRRIKTAYLTDDDIYTLVDRAAWIRGLGKEAS